MGNDALELIENFLHRAYECDQLAFSVDDLSRVRRAMDFSSSEKLESMFGRIEQEALNKISFALIDSVAKRLEYQMTVTQVNQCRLCLLIFALLSNKTKRFRDTIHCSHTIHIWLGLLRASVHWDANVLSDALHCINAAIVEINAEFNTEYAYWKKFIPELMDLLLQCKRKWQTPPYGSELQSIFFKLLKYDYSFLALAHSQLDQKRFSNLIHCAIEITHTHLGEFEWSNYLFCKQLYDEIEGQQWPEGISLQEKRNAMKLAKEVETVWESRVHRAEDQPMSASSDSESESVVDQDNQMDTHLQEQKRPHGKEEPVNGGELNNEQETAVLTHQSGDPKSNNNHSALSLTVNNNIIQQKYGNGRNQQQKQQQHPLTPQMQQNSNVNKAMQIMTMVAADIHNSNAAGGIKRMKTMDRRDQTDQMEQTKQEEEETGTEGTDEGQQQKGEGATRTMPMIGADGEGNGRRGVGKEEREEEEMGDRRKNGGAAAAAKRQPSVEKQQQQQAKTVMAHQQNGDTNETTNG